MCKKLIYLISIVLVLGLASSAHAVYVDNFDGYALGQVDAVTTNWKGTANTVIEGEYDNTANQVIRTVQSGSQCGAYCILSDSATIPNDGTTKTLFFRFRASSNQTDQAIGLTELDTPPITGDGGWSDFRAQIRVTAGRFDIRHGGTWYTDAATLNTGWTQPWYNVWMVITNNASENDTFKVYMHQSVNTGATENNRLKVSGGTIDTFNFRTNVSEALDRFYWKAQTGSQRIWLDTIYISDGVNLEIPEPAITVKASNPKPSNGGTVLTSSTILQWSPGAYAAGHDIYLGTGYNDVNNATRGNPLGVLISQGQEPNSYSASGLTFGTTYYWRIDEVNDINIWQGNVWSFKVLPATAYNPIPPDGAQRVNPNADLVWDPGARAKQHDVYLGSDISKVTDANRTNPMGVLVKQDHDATIYEPGTLSRGTTYYWRIDEVNEPDIWKGAVWRFTVSFAQAKNDEFFDEVAAYARDFAGNQLTATAGSIGTNQYPGYTDYSYSSWNLTDYSGWTSGFFPGCLWYMYESTGNSSFLGWAQTWTAGLQNEQYDTSKHDTGHIIFTSYGNGYRLTGNSDYKTVILQTAASYASRFNSNVGCIRSWNGYNFPVIIDNMVTLELLFWAAKNGGPSSYYDMAVSHAYKTLANHVRADGSTHHIVDYNSTTGQVIGYYAGQGMSVDSCWSRGLAWGLTGFTIVYRETNDPNMLAAAKKLADYFVDHLPADGIPYADFDNSSGSKDSSAAAIAASGLLELSTLVGDPDYRLKYYKCAKNILVSLCTKISGGGYLAGDASGDPLSPAVLMRACRAYGEPELSAIFGDYYLLEALLRYDAYNIYDLDGDGSIGFGDVKIIGGNWLKTGDDIPGDFYNDETNTVNFLDFAEFAQVW
jgi:unsaturated chondroitin disaccharide hydrolase